MGAVTAAAIGAVGAIGSGIMGNRAADRAADAQRDAANLGIGEQRRQFDTMQQNIQPYLAVGREGLSGLQALLSDPDSIKDSAAYQWQLGQGVQGLDRSAAARGGLNNGGHMADVLRFSQGLASQEYGNQWNRLAGLAGLGQNSAVGAGHMGQQNANALSNLYGSIGQAGAGQAINSANAWGNALSGLAGVAGQYMGQKQSAYQPKQNWGAFTPNGGTSMGGANNSLITGNYAGLNGWRV